MDPDRFAEDNHTMTRTELHTRYASPQRLSRELRELLGDSEFEVEMRHNVYNIVSAKPLNLETLLNKCQQRHRMNSTKGEIRRGSDSLF
ncbi:hypothetical protein BDZ45DRAFT_674001 [Acephala macrosclerotiorum]|nr:hypothetical protein BDZ45DRAFT_674001 [Acephala macrosclerotiorum]